MKKDIHPTLNPVIFRDASAGKDFFLYSTMTSEETEKHEGEEWFIVHLDVSSASHPFYTGKLNFVDTAGRVEKFNRRYKK